MLLISNARSIKNYFNRKGPFNVMSNARSLNEKGGIERPFILFHFTVFLMVLFKNKLDVTADVTTISRNYITNINAIFLSDFTQ